MSDAKFDLFAAARQEMIAEGFQPDFPPEVDQQLIALRNRPSPAMDGNVRDLRSSLWSSIDNDTSRDLDQAEVAERVNGGIQALESQSQMSIHWVSIGIAHRRPRSRANDNRLYRHQNLFDASRATVHLIFTSLNEAAGTGWRSS